MQNSKIHIYHGDGKGKTTAAMGLAVRAVGAGCKVSVIQFLKTGDSSEIKMLQKLDIETFADYNSDKFLWSMDENELCKVKISQMNLLDTANQIATSGEYDLLVLDEILGAVEAGIIEKSALMNLISNKSEDTELVLTGRNPFEELLSAADYVSKISAEKHPFEKGIIARKGIEF